MPIYTKESLETLKQRIDLVDVLSTHVDLKSAGATYKALCPFHDEKTPSFTVAKGDSHYHCFGCGAHGDAIQFLMNHLKMSFMEAVQYLAEKFRVHLEIVESREEERGPSRVALKEALSCALRFYHYYLLHTQDGMDALEYLRKRGIDREFVQQFQLGLAPKNAPYFQAFMKQQNVSLEIMEAAGLLSGAKDFFSDRILFPIHDAVGNVIGFSGRKYKEETFGGKYVNSKETALFKKSKVLFGLHHSRKRIAKEKQALIVEGQIDALRLIQVGINFTVAGQGTAFGEGHAKELIALGVQKIFLALDSDSAGQEATAKIGHLFQKAGVEVKVVRLPVGDDPDSFLVKNGAASFLKLIESSEEYLSFIIRYRSNALNLDSPAGKNSLIQTLAQQIRSWDHPVMVHETLRKLSHILQVPEAMVGVNQEFVPNLFIKRTSFLGQESIDPDKIMEGDFLRWLVLEGSLSSTFLPIAKQNIVPNDLHHPVCHKLYQFFLENPASDFLSLVIELDEPEVQAFLAELSEKMVNRDRSDEHFKLSIQKILDRNWMEKREEVKRKIQSGQLSDEGVLELVKEFDLLKKNQPKILI